MRLPIVASIALLPLVFAMRSLSAAEPTINIKSAVNSNKPSGSKVKVGDRIFTGAGGVVVGSFPWGGVKAISLLPNSSIMLRTYGFTAGGGRASEFDSSGELYVTVITTNPSSQVKICFSNIFRRRGCSLLRSSIKITPVETIGGLAIGVSEGNVIVQDEDEKEQPIAIPAGYYSLFDKNGKFSPPIKIEGTGYRIVMPRSKKVGTFKAEPGWFFEGKRTTIQAPIGAPVRIFSPIN